MAKRRNKTEQLENLINVVRFSLIKRAMKSKQKSKHTGKPCLNVPDGLGYNLDGIRYLTEIVEEGIIDNQGYNYDFSSLTAEQLCELADTKF